MVQDVLIFDTKINKATYNSNQTHIRIWTRKNTFPISEM